MRSDNTSLQCAFVPPGSEACDGTAEPCQYCAVPFCAFHRTVIVDIGVGRADDHHFCPTRPPSPRLYVADATDQSYHNFSRFGEFLTDEELRAFITDDEKIEIDRMLWWKRFHPEPVVRAPEHIAEFQRRCRYDDEFKAATVAERRKIVTDDELAEMTPGAKPSFAESSAMTD